MPIDLFEPEKGWVTTLHRLNVPTASKRSALFRLASRFSSLLGRRDVPDVISALHLNPRLFWPWLLFASRLMPYGKLTPTLREKVILRTAWNCRSRYEWGQHLEIAQRVGVTDADIITVTKGPKANTDTEEYAALLACDELCVGYQLSEATWRLLQHHFARKKLIELLMLIGHYQMIAGVLNSTGLTLEPAIEATLQAFYQRVTKNNLS